MMTFNKILLQFGNFEINFVKIQLSFIILKKNQKIQYIFNNIKIPLLKNILNFVQFYVTFVTEHFREFPNLSNSVYEYK